MDDVKKKILLDLGSSPVSLLPFATGICLLIGAWAFSSSFFGFLGICGVLAGMAMFVVRLIFQMDKLKEKAQVWRLNSVSKNREIKLDELDNKLCHDLDPRTETALRDLRSLHADFKKHLKDGLIKGQVGSIISENVDALFNGCVLQLRQSFEMFKAGRKMHGKERIELQKQRKEIVDDVVESIKELGKTITKCFSMATNRVSSMANKRKELQMTMEGIAKAEQEVEDMVNGRPTYSEAEFLEE
jgi:hypothetical protein